ncbi:MAG: HAD family hydrolase [Candidatus Aenigmatarchaeota archaeon]
MKYKLVAFDLDGTLGECEAESSWELIRKVFGIPNLWQDYLAGLVSREEAMKGEYEFWRYKDATKKKLQKLFQEKYRLVRGAKETIEVLKKKVKVVIISEGPCLAVSRIAKELWVKDIACNRIVFDSAGYAIETKPIHPSPNVRVSKALALKDFAGKFGLKLKECAAVGNDIEDSEMFKTAGFSIAFRPKDEKIKHLADAVVNDLKDIPRYLI